MVNSNSTKRQETQIEVAGKELMYVQLFVKTKQNQTNT